MSRGNGTVKTVPYRTENAGTGMRGDRREQAPPYEDEG
jgi:hypothetical protein